MHIAGGWFLCYTASIANEGLREDEQSKFTVEIGGIGQ